LPRSGASAPPAGNQLQESVMGKYFLGWLLGVPAIVLVVLWFFFR
jgi:hypothetical protein